MVEDVADLSVQYEEDGKVLCEEMDKKILSKGAWSTIIFKYRDANRTTGEMGKVKFTIRRYQKKNGAYRQASKFNISSEKQATSLIEALQEWLDQ